MRSQVIDIIKAIAIIMIVNVHLLSGQVFLIGSTYHVISFFFVAGLLQGIPGKMEKYSVRVFFHNRARRLLYPYLTLSALYIVTRVIIVFIRGKDLLDMDMVSSIVYTIMFRGVGTLWFIPVLFFAELIFFMLHKRGCKSWVGFGMGIAAIFSAYWLNVNGICGSQWYGDMSTYGLMVNIPISILLACFIAVLFIELGFKAYKRFTLLFTSKVNVVSKEFVIICLLCIISFILAYSLIPGYKGDIHKLDIGNPIIYLACSISGVTFVTCLSAVINAVLAPIANLLGYFGRNSLIIMTTHSEYFINAIVFYGLSSLLMAWGICDVNPKAVGLISLVIIMAVEAVLIYLVNNTILKYLYAVPPMLFRGKIIHPEK